MRKSIILFILTVITTTLTQSMQDVMIENSEQSLWLGFQPRYFIYGLRYSAPLMFILLVHEMGHFVFARMHRVKTSYPYFIPLPPLMGIGTMGAVISMKDRIRSNAALLDIGISGPIAGLVVCLPILALGLHWSEVKPMDGAGIQEGNSIVYWGMKILIKGSIPAGHDVFLHPMAWAGWLGLLLTSINLIPVGQLDGGHVAYSLFGNSYHRIAQHIPYAMIFFGVMSAMEIVPPGAGTYIVFGIFILIFVRSGHPPVDEESLPLDKKRKRVAAFGLILFGLIFTPFPLSPIELPDQPVENPQSIEAPLPSHKIKAPPID